MFPGSGWGAPKSFSLTVTEFSPQFSMRAADHLSHSEFSLKSTDPSQCISRMLGQIGPGTFNLKKKIKLQVLLICQGF
jgi:hypothetical protein